MSKKIDPKSTPKEVDFILQDNYSLSLYYFACSLNDLFYMRGAKHVSIGKSASYLMTWKDFWEQRLDELKKLKKYNQESIKILDRFTEKTEEYDIIEPQLEGWYWADKSLTIKDISRPLDDLIKCIEEDLLTPKRKSGSPPKTMNILFLVWSYFIRDKKKCHLNMLLSLIRWLHERVNHDDFKEIDCDAQYYSYARLLSRYKKGELKENRSIVEMYRKRFLVPIQALWLEGSISSGLFFKEPVVTFSNGEKLTPEDCLENNPSYKKYKKIASDPLHGYPLGFSDHEEDPFHIDTEWKPYQIDLITHTQVIMESEEKERKERKKKIKKK